jgi:hypothetical protein
MPNIPGVRGFVQPKVWASRPFYSPVQLMYLYFYKWSAYTFRGIKRDGNTITVTLFDNTADVFEEIKLEPKSV